MTPVTRRLAAAIVFGVLVLSGCAGTSSTLSPSPDADPPGDVTRLKFVVNGTLGDKSFFDSAAAGLAEVEASGAAAVEIVELGYDRTKWRPGFEDAAADDDYDVFIAGTFDATDIISSIAPMHPDKRFWFFDAPVDYEGRDGGCSNGCENVYSITFEQNEGGYLAGLIAAGTVSAGVLPGREAARRAGVIGGMELPVIQDFVTGFEAGWADGGGVPADLLVQYVGGNQPFQDPARAKDIANSMYGQGAAVVWPVAGASSFGVFEAAVDHDAYAIGIDADQAQTLTEPDERAIVITSILKNVGAALVSAAEQHAAGSLPYGEVATVGIAESAMGIVDDEQYRQFVPSAVRDAVVRAVEAIASGEIVVPSALGETS